VRGEQGIDLDVPLAEQSLQAAKVVLIEAASVADMRLSGEVAMSRRPDPLTPETQQVALKVCEALGAHRLAALIDAPSQPATALPAIGAPYSFRLDSQFGAVHLVATERPSLPPPDHLDDLKSALGQIARQGHTGVAGPI
jgi:hypothetical protein